MPSVDLAVEHLKDLQRKGRGQEKVHVVLVEQEQKERIANNKRKTRFVLCTDDADLCSILEAHKDRIFRRCGQNKSIMLHLMEKAWAEALADSEIDRIMAAMDGPDT